MCFTYLLVSQSILLKQKKSILIQDKKADKASKQSAISSSFPYTVVLFRRPSTIPLLEVEALGVSLYLR